MALVSSTTGVSGSNSEALQPNRVTANTAASSNPDTRFAPLGILAHLILDCAGYALAAGIDNADF